MSKKCTKFVFHALKFFRFFSLVFRFRQYLLLLDGSDDKFDDGARGGGDIGTRIGVVSCSEASNVGKSDINDWLVWY